MQEYQRYGSSLLIYGSLIGPFSVDDRLKIAQGNLGNDP